MVCFKDKIDFWAFLAALTLLVGCGSSVKVGKQIFSIQIFGVSISPDGATGNEDPTWQKYTLTGVSFLSQNGAEATALYDGADAAEAQVVDRPQIIYSKDVSAYDSQTFAGITATFAADIVGAFGKKEDYTFTMPQPTLQHDEVFKIEAGKSLDLIVKIDWKNTVGDEGMSLPTYDLTLRK